MPFTHSLSVNVPVEPNGITRMSGCARCVSSATSSTMPICTVWRNASGPPGKAVQEIEHGVSAVRIERVAGGQIDVRLLVAAAERGAVHEQPLQRPGRVTKAGSRGGGKPR